MKISIIALLALSLLVSCSGSKKNQEQKVENDSVVTQNDNGSNDQNKGSGENDKTAVAFGEGTGKSEYLSTQAFVDHVFDFRTQTEWKYKGSVPAVVDFYADWCRPCKLVAPIMDELANEYKGKVQFYKVNTDMEPDVANAFGIQSIPSILFIPMEGKGQMTTGAMTKSEYKKLIEQVIFGKQ